MPEKPTPVPTPGELAGMLRAGAAGYNPHEAAAALRAAGELPCSSSAGQIPAVACSIAAGVPVDLRDAVGGLDARDIGLVERAVRYANGRRPASRPASVRDAASGAPMPGDAWAERHRELIRAEREAGPSPWLPLLTEAEAETVAALLDEHAAEHPGEELGRLARELAVALNDRRGV